MMPVTRAAIAVPANGWTKTNRPMASNVALLRLSYRYNGRMRQALKVHPDSLCSAVTHIEVEIMRPCAGSLVLSYLVTGRIGDLHIPAAVAAARTDELWRRTCFHSSALRPAPLLRIQLCALNTMGGISVRQHTLRGARRRHAVD